MTMQQQDKQYDRSPEEWLESHAKRLGSGKISHALITPGRTWEEALAKATFPNQKYANAVILCMAELEQRRAGLKSEHNKAAYYILNCVQASSSIFGKARFEAIEADSNIIAPSAHETFITGKPALNKTNQEKSHGIFRKEQKKQEGQSID